MNEKDKTMTLRQAIDRSRSHNEIVSIEYAATDSTELELALGDIYDGQIDSACENDGAIDVWGWTEEMADGEMDWRLRVTLTTEAA